MRAAAGGASSSSSRTRIGGSFPNGGGINNKNTNPYLNQMLGSAQSVADVIDLSSTTTPTRSNAAVAAAALQQHQQYLQHQQQQYYQQQQHQQQAAAAQQQHQSQPPQRGSNAARNGSAELANCLNLLSGGAQTVVGRGRGGSTADDLSSAAASLMNKSSALANAPYKMQKAFIDGVQVTCINMKAYQHTDLLMRVQDLCDKFFPQSTHENCRRVLEVFNVVIYRGNR